MTNPWAIDKIGEQLTGERTSRVWAYWRNRYHEGIAPTWDRFDLIELYKDAPIILVLDVLKGPELIDYRYRFVGTTIVQYRWKLPQPDHTGMTYYEARHQYDFKAVKEAYDLCTETKAPAVMQRNFDALDATGTHERLILPIVSADGGETEKLVVVVERQTETKKATPADPPLF